MINIKLNYNNGFTWFELADVAIKGYFFDDGGHLYKSEQAVDYFKNVNVLEDFIAKLKNINGSFVMVIIKGKQVFAAVDHLRSMPLFYFKDNANISISDDGWHLVKKENLSKLSKISIGEFLLSGNTIGNNTLFDELYQLQAGQYLYYDDETKKLRFDFYYKHLHGDYLELTKDTYFHELDLIYDNVFERLIKSAEGKTIVVPLSGGYDSRSIVAMLKKLRYDNVVCFTYGRLKSVEVQTAKKVVKELGFKWYFIDYSGMKGWTTLIGDYSYLRFASNAASLPHIQEYIALLELRKKSVIPKSSIIIPGFSADLLGGSYVPKEILSGNNEILFDMGTVEYVFSHYFNLDNPVSGECALGIRNRIQIELLKLSTERIKNCADFDSVVEAFFTNHKVAKFVVNALRIYEYFGYEWRMPLWDKKLHDFFYRVPIGYRTAENNLYNEYLFENLFKQFKISYKKRSGVIRSVRTSHRFIRFLPLGERIWTLMKDFYSTISKYRACVIDFNAFSNLYAICSSEFSEKSINHIPSSYNINSIFSLWFLTFFLGQK